MVSTTGSSFDYELVRLLYGDARGDGEIESEAVPGLAGKGCEGKLQATHPGSYGVVDVPWRGPPLEEVAVSGWMVATRIDVGRPQWLLGTLRRGSGGPGFGLFIDEEGRLVMTCGCRDAVPPACRTDAALEAGQWYRVSGKVDAQRRRVAVAAERLRAVPRQPDLTAEMHVDGRLELGEPDTIVLAAQPGPTPASHPTGFFDGKLEAFAVHSEALDRSMVRHDANAGRPREGLVASWDFSRNIDSQVFTDTSGHERHGRFINGPTRAVTGHNWDGSILDFKQAPEQYGAVHFHADDLDDAAWDVSFTVNLPPNLRSGFYAARVRSGDEEDYIPLAVSPSRRRPQATVVVLAPTLTYLAYANLQPLEDAELDWNQVTDLGIGVDPRDRMLEDHPEFGRSLYDTHDDGSGVAYSSTRRPLLTLRPDYLYPMVHAPRGLSGDLYLIKWLELLGVPYDLISDNDLADEGAKCLDGVDVVLTGGHPEYWTLSMLTALEAFLEDGGRLMYLGGNGFYWVTSVDPAREHVIEVRRGVAGLRTWEGAPGEGFHSTTGEPGGLWRYRGRPPNGLVGVGFAAQGWSRDAAGYIRQPDAEDPRASFIFDGVDDEVIGSRGITLDGASGDEIDRADRTLGTPQHALIVATSERHSNLYQVVVEDVMVTMPNLGGEDDDRVRSDMVYLEYPNGGAVFSVGSICWLGAMAFNAYENSAARVTENVLREFMRR